MIKNPQSHALRYQVYSNILLYTDSRTDYLSAYSSISLHENEAEVLL